jgi:hypothetical protein
MSYRLKPAARHLFLGTEIVDVITRTLTVVLT